MKTAARYKAVWELMTAVFADRQPADNIINAYFRERRFIGSGDRRFIAEKIWHIIRRRRRLTFEAGSADPRKLLIACLKDEDPAEIFDGGEYGLPPLNDDERKLGGRAADGREDISAGGRMRMPGLAVCQNRRSFAA